jgi:peptidoglycan/xylan/chitin deacetylase (PgdA/CDA1 family)
MKARICRVSLFVLVLLTFCGPVSAGDFKWPDGKKAAVSISYDDTLDSQLDHALPVLNKHKIKASFYLKLASPVLDARLQEWRAVAEQGHELGNHAIFHACSLTQGATWVAPHNNMDKRTVEQMREEILTANTFLKAIDGRSERTLTTPCGHTITSNGNYVPAVRDLFVAIKGEEINLPFAAEFVETSGASAEQLIAFVEKMAAKGGLAHILFHGVGGDYLSVSKEAHEKLIQYLAAHRDIYWTDTYLNIMQYVNAAPTAKSK